MLPELSARTFSKTTRFTDYLIRVRAAASFGPRRVQRADISGRPSIWRFAPWLNADRMDGARVSPAEVR